MKKIIFIVVPAIWLISLLIIVNILTRDDRTITVNDYLEIIIPGKSTINDVATLDSAVFRKIEYIGNITYTLHFAEDTGEPIIVYYDKQLNVEDFDCFTLNPSLYDPNIEAWHNYFNENGLFIDK